MKRNLILSLAAAVSFGANLSRAELLEFYVGIDGREILPSGTYRGLPNPNFGRLSFLYAHGYKFVPGLAPVGENSFANNHYHVIGGYSYSGPTNAPVVNPTSANNRIPEVSTRRPPLTLVPGTGLYAGKLVSAKTAEHYSDLRMRSTQDLNRPDKYGPGSPEWIMFHSSGGTRTNRLDGAVVALELVEKTPGLNIGTPDQLHVLINPGDRHVLGEGNTLEFQPVFWVEGDSPVGTYSASFKLVDMNTEGGRTPFPESGIFHLDFRVAPPPSLAIQRAVHLTLPQVIPGYVLESAPTVEGPWTPVEMREAREVGTDWLLSLPADMESRLFRLRRE